MSIFFSKWPPLKFFKVNLFILGKQNYMIFREKKNSKWPPQNFFFKMATTEFFFFRLEITRNMKKREKKKSNLFLQNGRHGVPHAGQGLKINRR